ncbi:hypothetical protein MRB53_027856 [Persea americana]|uniref:Uncharacterized protein n=1 Tax=Persea americana TaxID=3435 RepID=A0ACC2KE85_PERAE|nr:hypothetical protein MRB53_027856 [Persea americana]
MVGAAGQGRAREGKEEVRTERGRKKRESESGFRGQGGSLLRPLVAVADDPFEPQAAARFSMRQKWALDEDLGGAWEIGAIVWFLDLFDYYVNNDDQEVFSKELQLDAKV